MMTTKDAMDTGTLADWAREFAIGKLPVCDNPEPAAIQQAIARHLPEKVKGLPAQASAQELLEQSLGIAVIVQYGREQISWSATTNAKEAEALHQLHSAEPYRKIWEELGIASHWILLVDSECLDVYGIDELMAAEPYPVEMYEQYPHLLQLQDRQQCVLVEL